MHHVAPLGTMGIILMAAAVSRPALANDPAPAPEGRQPLAPEVGAAVQAGIDYLKRVQNDDGSWSPTVGPAITALALAAMLDAPGGGLQDAATRRALAFVLSFRRPDGGIHAGMLGNYNTAISVSAVARLPFHAEAQKAMADGRDYLIRIQWHGQEDAAGVVVGPEHPFFGGSGYGKHGRPDLSNTQTMLQALHDSGLSPEDPAYQRALVFISRCQGSPTNDLFADAIASDGGFIYSTSTDKDHVGQPQSMAGGGSNGSGSTLRTYGSMTYAGFKSLVYAGLAREDRRVVDALGWIRRYHTVTHNPGMPEDRQREGYFYYLVTMARALDAWGEPELTTSDGARHDWASELVTRLMVLQRDDGSWINSSSRWMETDPNLVTAYALTALLAASNPR